MKSIQVERGAVVLTVPETMAEYYYDQGYDILDDSGNVVKAAVPADNARLRMDWKNHVEEISRLRAENALLRKQISELSVKMQQPQTAKNSRKKTPSN